MRTNYPNYTNNKSNTNFNRIKKINFDYNSQYPNALSSSMSLGEKTNKIFRGNRSKNDVECTCSCHYSSVLCCPCDKGKDSISSDYYKDLYMQVKSELEIEKKKNDRISYSQKLHDNNLQASMKEKQNLLSDINHLKAELD